MNYEYKYLKYKAKYIAAKAELDELEGGNKIKNTQKVLELHNRNILVLEQAIKGRINKLKNSEDQKMRGVEKLKINNTPVKEINEFIESMDYEINDIKKELIIKNKELEKQKKLLEKAKINKN
jgi:hypothetical protein